MFLKTGRSKLWSCLHEIIIVVQRVKLCCQNISFLFGKMIQKTFFFLFWWNRSIAVLFFFFSWVQNEWMWVEEWVDSSMLKSRKSWRPYVDLIIFTKTYLTTIDETVIMIRHIFGERNCHLFHTRVLPIYFSSFSVVFFIFYLQMYSFLHHLILKLAGPIKNVQNSVLLQWAKLTVTRWCLWFDDCLHIQGDFVRNGNAMFSDLLYLLSTRDAATESLQ